MNNTFQVQVVRRGVITLPKELRDQNHIEEGDFLTLIDLGDGVVVMSPRRSRVDEIATGRGIAQGRGAWGVEADHDTLPIESEVNERGKGKATPVGLDGQRSAQSAGRISVPSERFVFPPRPRSPSPGDTGYARSRRLVRFEESCRSGAATVTTVLLPSPPVPPQGPRPLRWKDSIASATC